MTVDPVVVNAIRIVPYDSAWPRQYEAEAERISAAFGGWAARIEHVGSTAVPGLDAKPIIDIQVSVPSLQVRERFVEPLVRLGYTHVPLGDFDRVYPFFCKPSTWPSTHHVHVCEAGSAQEASHLAFRNHLRDDPRVAAEYVVLKRRLAQLHHGTTLESRRRYSMAKSEFVASVLAGTFRRPGESSKGNGA
jgi:GrpB-like predicted nucleotidyltransferase (UPF0157 family)